MANVKDLLVNGSARVIGTIYGNATSANKLNTNAGSASQPVYFSNGVPVAITGSLSNNAASATKLLNARNFKIGNTSKSFNGTADVTWTHAEIGATVSNTWTGGTTAGPTLSTTVNGVKGTAVAIPSASTSASGIITTGTQSFAGLKSFEAIGVTNTSNSSGKGISLYNGATSGAPTYGLMFAGTGTFGTHGGVTSDWATYFTMSDTTNRGWIFRRGSTNIASISGKGVLTNKAISQLITGGTAVAAVTSSPYKPTTWAFNAGLDLVDGLSIIIKMPAAGHDYGVFLSVDNGTTYKPIILNGTGRLTTHYPNGSYLHLVYEPNASASRMFPLAGGTSRTTVTGGAWRVINYYDSNSDTYTSAYCGTAAATAAKSASMTYYTATANSYVHINFRYSNTAKSALTLNINGQGAKSIYINGVATSSSNYTLPAGPYIAYYNGTNYYLRTDGKLPASIDGNANTATTATNLSAAGTWTWSNGTTAGPTASLVLGGKTTSIGAIPAASSSTSGIITTGAQTFAGAKTFTGNTRIQLATPNLYLRDTSTSADTYAIMRFGNNANENAAYIFLNGPNRTNDGGTNMFTIRNNVGNLRLNNDTINTGKLTIGQAGLNTSYTQYVNGTIGNPNGLVSFVQNNLIIGNTTDFNTLTIPGCYKVQMSNWGAADTYHSPNQWGSIYSFGLLLVFRGAASDGEQRIHQIYFPHQTAGNQPILNRMHNGSDINRGWQNWTRMARDCPTLTGTGATGTWGISITGNAATASLLKNVGSNCTASASTWNAGRGGTIVWGERWTSTNYTYTPSGGSATTISDSGDITLYVKAGSTTSNTLTLNMAIDGEIYAGGGFVGNISGNATSATKLKTARTIWGQSFNGTANISGDISNAGNIKANANLSRNIGESTVNFNNIYTRALAIRHIDAGTDTVNSDHQLYIGYGSITHTSMTRFYYSSSTSSRTEYLQINSNGAYALTRFGVNGQNTGYNFYVNGSSNITGNLKLDGSITNLAVNGGIYWNPYVESASDASDAASITVVKSGVAGGTELRISQANDSNDIVNISVPTNDAARINNNIILNAANYTNYTVTKTGGGASGTWGINISGNASTSSLSGVTERLDSFDTRSATRTPQDTPRGITLNFKQNSTYGLSDGGGYIGLLSWRSYATGGDLTGGYPIEIAYTQNGNLWTRLGSSSTAWGSWRKILDSSNYSSTLDSSYVKKTGDTMTGNLTAPSVYTSDWFRSTGSTGWYSETYGGGWYMSDSTYVRCYNNKMVYSGGRFLSPSTSSSWIDGQRYARGGYNLEDATNSGSYWPWMRQTNSNTSKWFSFGTLGTSFYWIGSSTSRTDNGYDYGMEFNIANGYLTGCSRVYSAVWNDYAEYRKSDITEPGRVVIENGDGTLSLSTKRLQRGAEVISDTFGFAIGETDECKTPIAATGRVLAYTYEPVEEYRSKTGWPVCSGPNGTVSIMTEEEEEKYPSRIIGTISEVPNYEEWGTGKVKTNGRVWIRIK